MSSCACNITHFLVFAFARRCVLSASAQFRTHCLPSSTRRRYDLPDAACLASSADRCSVSIVRACVPCLAWSALLPVMCNPSGCDGVLGSPPLGYMGRAGGGVVDTSRRKNSKKAFFGVPLANPHPTFTNQNPSDCASLQKFRKIQKGPSRSLDCAIIS